MKTRHHFSTFFMTFLFASVLACTAGQSYARETTKQYVDDTTITTEIKSKMLAQKELKASEIHVETYKGTVQLSGFVSGQDQVKKAEEIAKTVKGVQKVENNILLKN